VRRSGPEEIRTGQLSNPTLMRVTAVSTSDSIHSIKMRIYRAVKQKLCLKCNSFTHQMFKIERILTLARAKLTFPPQSTYKLRALKYSLNYLIRIAVVVQSV